MKRRGPDPVYCCSVLVRPPLFFSDQGVCERLTMTPRDWRPEANAFAGLRDNVFRVAPEFGAHGGVNPVSRQLQASLVPHPLPGGCHVSLEHHPLGPESRRCGEIRVPPCLSGEN